jgi:hypothetical protein
MVTYSRATGWGLVAGAEKKAPPQANTEEEVGRGSVFGMVAGLVGRPKPIRALGRDSCKTPPRARHALPRRSATAQRAKSMAYGLRKSLVKMSAQMEAQGQAKAKAEGYRGRPPASPGPRFHSGRCRALSQRPREAPPARQGMIA